MKLRITVILFAVVSVSVGYVPAKAANFTEFTGNDTFVRLISPGTIRCPGGELADPPFPSPCTTGSRVHLRDGDFLYYFTSSDDRITGSMELTSANGNYDGWIPNIFGPGSGQMWGTMRITVEGHPTEVWEGTWNGTRTVIETEDGYAVVITTHNVLFGTGGRIQGLKAEFTGVADPSVGGSYKGWILAPPGKSGK